MSEEDYKSVGEIKNQWVETKDEYLDIALNVIDNLKIKNQQLKEAIEEVREYINHEWFKRGQLGIIDKSFQEWQLKDILQILDKVRGN